MFSIILKPTLLLLLLLFATIITQGIFNYIPEANHVPRAHSAEVVQLYKLVIFPKYTLYFYIVLELLRLLFLSQLRWVHTIIYLKTSMLLGYIVSQLFCCKTL